MAAHFDFGKGDPMTDAELLVQVKAGIGHSGAFHDGVILPKAKAVVGYMSKAGVNIENLYSDTGIACICIGVTDIWNISSGEIKFSPVFEMMLNQLAIASLPEVT